MHTHTNTNTEIKVISSANTIKRTRWHETQIARFTSTSTELKSASASALASASSDGSEIRNGHGHGRDTIGIVGGVTLSEDGGSSEKGDGKDKGKGKRRARIGGSGLKDRARDRDRDREDYQEGGPPHAVLTQETNSSANAHAHTHANAFKWDTTRSDPGTPNLSETAASIRRNLSSATLATALSTLSTSISSSSEAAIEREKLLKRGKKMVWRDEREIRKLPQDAERAFVLAGQRGLRSLVLAWLVRSGVNVLLMLMRTIPFGRRRRQRTPGGRSIKWTALIRHALFGPEPLRFAAMIGSFTFLNTLTLHLLRLAPPASYIRKRLRRVWNWDSSPLTFGPPERYMGPTMVDTEAEEKGASRGDPGVPAWFEEEDSGERRWQAPVAGAVASLGLLCEEKGRRAAIAQQ